MHEIPSFSKLSEESGLEDDVSETFTDKTENSEMSSAFVSDFEVPSSESPIEETTLSVEDGGKPDQENLVMATDTEYSGIEIGWLCFKCFSSPDPKIYSP